MQTDQFDEEFRKKLLDINPVTDEDEVDRIHNYVSSKGKIAHGFTWTKILLYGTAAALLTGSLTFNYIQNQTNKTLFSSLDSLRSHITYLDSKTFEKVITRVDTVYLERYINKPFLPQTNQEQQYNRQTFNDGKLKDEYFTHDQYERNLPVLPVDSLIDNTIQTAETYDNSSIADRISGRKKGDKSYRNILTDNALINRSYLRENSSNQTDYKKANNSSATPSPENTTAISLGIKSRDSGSLTRMGLLSELSTIGDLNPGLTRLKLPQLKQPKIAVPPKVKPKYYSEPVKSILKKMEYYAGGSFDVGGNQIGGSLIGELRITPKWSFQTGLRWTQVNGEGYFTAEQYSQRTGQDFRALYAPYVAQNVDLLNIDQNYQLLQIPLMVAYHYNVFPNWTLRLGLGTDVSVFAQKHIHFDYKENNLSYDQGEYNAKLAVRSFNDLTINVGVERRWNKFLFRASPYITPQLRRTEYFREELSWGGRVQVLYRFK